MSIFKKLAAIYFCIINGIIMQSKLSQITTVTLFQIHKVHILHTDLSFNYSYHTNNNNWAIIIVAMQWTEGYMS